MLPRLRVVQQVAQEPQVLLTKVLVFAMQSPSIQLRNSSRDRLTWRTRPDIIAGPSTFFGWMVSQFAPLLQQGRRFSEDLWQPDFLMFTESGPVVFGDLHHGFMQHYESHLHMITLVRRYDGIRGVLSGLRKPGLLLVKHPVRFTDNELLIFVDRITDDIERFSHLRPRWSAPFMFIHNIVY